jgi:DNA-binding GntR family transcriptional regulator
MLLQKKRVDRSKPLRHQAANLVQDAIMNGLLQPGEKIAQRMLASHLGLSQSSVREALQELEYRGLLVKNHRSYTITQLSLDEFIGLFQVRVPLESLVCQLAANSWSELLDIQLEECLTKMNKAAAERNPLEFWHHDMEFHRIIWRHQPNRFLERYLNMLCMPLFAYYLTQPKQEILTSTRFERDLREHQLILSVLRTRDGARVEKVVSRIFERSLIRSLEYSRKIKQSGPAIPR